MPNNQGNPDAQIASAPDRVAPSLKSSVLETRHSLQPGDWAVDISRPVLLAFHKPYGVLSRFTGDGSPHQTLAGFGFPKGVYPIGRLDAKSEGLLLLSDETELNIRLLHPRRGHRRVYWVQVEGRPTEHAIARLEGGIQIEGYATLPARAWILSSSPNIPPRNPPIRYRKNVPDTWMGLELIEGKNHQVRRMTAAVGHPTLRLVRAQIGGFSLGKLPPGRWREVTRAERAQILE